MSQIKQLLIIGCGNMGGAMLAGWLRAGIAPSRLAVLDAALDAANSRLTAAPAMQTR